MEDGRMIYAGLGTATKLEIFSIIEACNMLKTEVEFKGVFKRINSVLGQEMAAFGIGDAKSKKIISSVNVGFSSDFMATIVDTSGRIKSPLFRLWLERQTPQMLDLSHGKVVSAPDRFSSYLEFSLQNIMSHGVMDYSRQYVTYFGFAQIPEKIGMYHIRLLDILAPNLHVAYSRIIGINKPLFKSTNTACGNPDEIQPQASMTTLTARENEVLRWLFEGK